MLYFGPFRFQRIKSSDYPVKIIRVLTVLLNVYITPLKIELTQLKFERGSYLSPPLTTCLYTLLLPWQLI